MTLFPVPLLVRVGLALWFLVYWSFGTASAYSGAVVPVSYGSCSYAYRNDTLRLLKGLVCDGVTYGDCSFAVSVGSSVPYDFSDLRCVNGGSLWRLRALDFYASPDAFPDSETVGSATFPNGSWAVFSGAVRVPDPAPPNSVTLPLSSDPKKGLRLFGTPFGDLSLDMDSFELLLVVLLSLYFCRDFIISVLRAIWYFFKG